MDEAIEAVSLACQPCMIFNKAPSKAPIIPWTTPTRPSGRVYQDFLEVRRGASFIVAADGLSGWLDAERTKSMDSETAIRFCRRLFRVQGLPQTNGVAERGVQTVKNFLKKVPEAEWNLRLDSFLLGHNSTPHSTSGIAPAEFNLGRRPVTVLAKSQKPLPPRLPVVVRSYKDPKIKWEPARLIRLLGPRRVLAETPDGLVDRHLDQVKMNARPPSVPAVSAPTPPVAASPAKSMRAEVPILLPPAWEEVEDVPAPDPPEATQNQPPTPARPARERKLPGKFKDFVMQ
ncbi:uncharacterized protein LOC135937598 [Cloeon dipterum]|uniref:uncharacterized protein LOC135937598 n=1 Tax=Cloeon dipterum TaxID=197152 RepID=UPI00322029C2